MGKMISYIVVSLSSFIVGAVLFGIIFYKVGTSETEKVKSQFSEYREMQSSEALKRSSDLKNETDKLNEKVRALEDENSNLKEKNRNDADTLASGVDDGTVSVSIKAGSSLQKCAGDGAVPAAAGSSGGSDNAGQKLDPGAAKDYIRAEEQIRENERRLGLCVSYLTGPMAEYRAKVLASNQGAGKK